MILNWNENAHAAFENLVEVICSDLVLILPNFNGEFSVTTDASEVGYGAVLEQVHNGENRSIAYFSKCYTVSQKNYSTSEKELLSIVMAVENWSVFLYGRKFVVYSDHQPIAWLLN